jgi:hypothetical protein
MLPALPIASASAQIAPPRLEESKPKDAIRPFDEKTMKRFNAGFAPPILTYCYQDIGWICEGMEWSEESKKMEGRWVNGYLTFTRQPFITRANELPPELDGTASLRVLRNARGEIEQIQSPQYVTFVSKTATGWKAEFWSTGDTMPTPGVPASRSPLPDKPAAGAMEVEEVPTGEKDRSETLTRFTSTEARNNPKILRDQYWDYGQEVKNIHECYSGTEMKPEALYKRYTWTRTRIPNSNRYRQVILNEWIRDGKGHVTEHKEEIWSVAPDGARTKVEEKDLRKNQAQKPEDFE